MIIILVLWVFAIFPLGFITGTIVHRRKRDKEMAHLIAERLMGKAHNSYSPDPQAASGQYSNSWGSSQQAGASLQSSYLSSMLGNVGAVSGHKTNTLKGTN